MYKDTVLKFINAINKQDILLITEMMSEEFVFIDTYGNHEEKDKMITGWKEYFRWFPDYYIDIESNIENDEFSVVIGRASGSYLGNVQKHWEFPAAWKVVTIGNQVSVWQVFCDSKKQLDSMK